MEWKQEIKRTGQKKNTHPKLDRNMVVRICSLNRRPI